MQAYRNFVLNMNKTTIIVGIKDVAPCLGKRGENPEDIKL